MKCQKETVYRIKGGCRGKKFNPIIDEASFNLENLYLWFVKSKTMYHRNYQVVGQKMS